MAPEEIKGLREKLNLTQAEFAERIHVNRVTLARWERGKNEPRGLYLRALHDLAGKAKWKRKTSLAIKK